MIFRLMSKSVNAGAVENCFFLLKWENASKWLKYCLKHKKKNKIKKKSPQMSVKQRPLVEII